MKSTFLCLSLFALLSTACKKDKDEAKPVTKEDLAGTYVITSVKAQAGTPNEVDYTELVFDDCQRDDTYVLKADGTYTIDDNANTCPDSPEGGVWDFKDNKFTIEAFSQTGNLKSWDGKTLVVENTVSVSGFTQTVQVTFTRQ